MSVSPIYCMSHSVSHSVTTHDIKKFAPNTEATGAILSQKVLLDYSLCLSLTHPRDREQEAKCSAPSVFLTRPTSTCYYATGNGSFSAAALTAEMWWRMSGGSQSGNANVLLSQPRHLGFTKRNDCLHRVSLKLNFQTITTSPPNCGTIHQLKKKSSVDPSVHPNTPLTGNVFLFILRHILPSLLQLWNLFFCFCYRTITMDHIIQCFVM